MYFFNGFIKKYLSGSTRSRFNARAPFQWPIHKVVIDLLQEVGETGASWQTGQVDKLAF